MCSAFVSKVEQLGALEILSILPGKFRLFPFWMISFGITAFPGLFLLWFDFLELFAGLGFGFSVVLSFVAREASDAVFGTAESEKKDPVILRLKNTANFSFLKFKSDQVHQNNDSRLKASMLYFPNSDHVLFQGNLPLFSINICTHKQTTFVRNVRFLR